MLDTIITVLIGLLLVVAVGAGIVGYIIWRGDRRVDDAAAEMARQAGGGGGPTKPVVPK